MWCFESNFSTTVKPYGEEPSFPPSENYVTERSFQVSNETNKKVWWRNLNQAFEENSQKILWNFVEIYFQRELNSLKKKSSIFFLQFFVERETLIIWFSVRSFMLMEKIERWHAKCISPSWKILSNLIPTLVVASHHVERTLEWRLQFKIIGIWIIFHCGKVPSVQD